MGASAHNGVVHRSEAEAAAHVRSEATASAPVPPPTPSLPFPVDITARFDLLGPGGVRRTEADYRGGYVTVFFGYANCESICDVALPRLADALGQLDGATSDRITPLFITVDPERDTPETMQASLARWSPRFVGLTGSEAALADARDAFQVETKRVGESAFGHVFYSHGSFVYLLGPDGKVLTVLPPILSPERMAEIIDSYVNA